MRFNPLPFLKTYQDVKANGTLCSPRGQKVLEIEHYTYQLPPNCRFTTFWDRNLNMDYVREEFMWYLNADRYDLSICDHAKMWKNFIAEDSIGGYLNSNYGWYIFGPHHPGISYVLEELKNDKDSRRASIAIFGSDVRHTLKTAKDVPCTYSLNFRIRNNKLNMSVHMRSQDAIFGMSNDAPCFSMVQEIVFTRLKGESYPDLELGTYTHTADSFHVYERHFNMLEQLCSPSVQYSEVEVPRMTHEESVILSNCYQRIDNLKEIEKGTNPFIDWLKFREINDY